MVAGSGVCGWREEDIVSTKTRQMVLDCPSGCGSIHISVSSSLMLTQPLVYSLQSHRDAISPNEGMLAAAP